MFLKRRRKRWVWTGLNTHVTHFTVRQHLFFRTISLVRVVSYWNTCGEINYRPQRSWGKVIFSQASVILSTGGGGVPWQAHPPGPGTPPRTRYTSPGPGTPPRTRYTPGTRYTPQDWVHPPGTRYTPRDQVHPLGAVHAGRYGPPAGGTHPTGMHSCFLMQALSVFVHFGGKVKATSLPDGFIKNPI